MFYARYTIDGAEKEVLYFDNRDFIKDTFSPNTQIDFILDFIIYGKDYQSKKAWLHNLAVEWSNHGDVGSLYMSDLWHISDWFYRNGKRYGLLHEFRENGLC